MPTEVMKNLQNVQSKDMTNKRNKNIAIAVVNTEKVAA